MAFMSLNEFQINLTVGKSNYKVQF